MHLAGFLHCHETETEDLQLKWTKLGSQQVFAWHPNVLDLLKRLLKARVSPNGTTFARSCMHDIHNKCCVCIKYFVTNYQVCNVMCESIFFHREIQQNVALDHKEISNYFCFLVSISILLDMETRKKNDCWLMENTYLRNNCT